MDSSHPTPDQLPPELDTITRLLASDASSVNGDDAAVLHAPGARVCVTTDTAIDGIHLHEALTPRERGYRAAACALSDIAAMAARPIGVVSAISVPDHAWDLVPEISAGIEQRCAESGCHLVGGDLVSSPRSHRGWSITITCIGVTGSAAHYGFLARSGARPGDVIAVTGLIGRSAASRSARDVDGVQSAIPWSWYTSPPNRIRAAQAIAPWATSLIDLSDGVLSDVRHVASRSGVGVDLDLDLLPIEATVISMLERSGQADARLAAAGAGDDYELLLTAPEPAFEAARDALATAEPGLPLTIVGKVADSNTIVVHHGGTPVSHVPYGYAHR